MVSFGSQGVGASGRRGDGAAWDTALQYLVEPELEEDAYLQACLSQGFVLSFYAHVLVKVRRGRVGEWATRPPG